MAHPRHAGKGCPRKEASPTTHQWQIVATVTVNKPRVAEELESEALSDQELVTTYKEQGGVERGFRFLKEPLFLASSVFVKKPERIIALSLIMVLCLLVYRLAEVRLRARLAETEQTIPDQVHKPTARPTMRLSSSNALRALSCSMCRPQQPHSPSSYVLKRFID